MRFFREALNVGCSVFLILSAVVFGHVLHDVYHTATASPLPAVQVAVERAPEFECEVGDKFEVGTMDGKPIKIWGCKTEAEIPNLNAGRLRGMVRVRTGSTFTVTKIMEVEVVSTKGEKYTITAVKTNTKVVGEKEPQELFFVARCPLRGDTVKKIE